MRRRCGRRKFLDLRGLGHIDLVRRHLAPALGELGGGGGKAGLVAVGNGEIAAARGELDRERPADAARRPRYRGGASVDRSHQDTPSAQKTGRRPQERSESDPRAGFPSLFSNWNRTIQGGFNFNPYFESTFLTGDAYGTVKTIPRDG